MSAHLDRLAGRRAELVARSDANREALAASFGTIERRLWLVERVVGAARRLHRYGAVAGAVAVGLILAPRSSRSRLRGVVRALPLVIEFFRVVRSRRERGPSSAG